jgi:hypothetical protein
LIMALVQKLDYSSLSLGPTIPIMLTTFCL